MRRFRRGAGPPDGEVGTEEAGTEEAGPEEAGPEEAGPEEAGPEEAGTEAPDGDSDVEPEMQAAPGQSTGRLRTRWVASDGAWETTLRGRQIMNDPRLFRGVAFTEAERRELGLVGLLPPQVISLREQLRRAYGQYQAQPTQLAKNVYLGLLQDRNEVLFFRLLSEHLSEMLPVIYTPEFAGSPMQGFPAVVADNLGGYATNAYQGILPEDWYIK